MIDKTATVHAELSHPASKAALGLILDGARKFNDKWHTFQTPHSDTGVPPPGSTLLTYDQLAQLRRFYEDLGELRHTVLEGLEFLTECVDDSLKAENLFPSEGE